MQHFKLLCSYSLNIVREFPGKTPIENPLCFAAFE